MENIHSFDSIVKSYYGRFVDLWKNADPDLQPRGTEGRAWAA